MKYCTFKEVKKIEEMCDNNPYLYGVIDPSCAICDNGKGNNGDYSINNFDPRDLYYISTLPEDEQPDIDAIMTERMNKGLLRLRKDWDHLTKEEQANLNQKYNYKNMLVFATSYYQTDKTKLQPLLEENNYTCSAKILNNNLYQVNSKRDIYQNPLEYAKIHNFLHLYPLQLGESISYLSPLQEVYRGGVIINVNKVMEDLSTKSGRTAEQKQATVKYYNTLVEYGYVSSVYDFLCQKIQEYISLIHHKYINHTTDLNSLFGYIYQEYIEPALLSLQQYFIDFKINKDTVKYDKHLFEVEPSMAYSSRLNEMTIDDYNYTLYSLVDNNNLAIDATQVKSTVQSQSYVDKLNSVLHLLISYNKKVSMMLSKDYAFTEKPYKSYQELVKDYDSIKELNQIYAQLDDTETESDITD